MITVALRSVLVLVVSSPRLLMLFLFSRFSRAVWLEDKLFQLPQNGLVALGNHYVGMFQEEMVRPGLLLFHLFQVYFIEVPSDSKNVLPRVLGSIPLDLFLFGAFVSQHLVMFIDTIDKQSQQEHSLLLLFGHHSPHGVYEGSEGNLDREEERVDHSPKVLSVGWDILEGKGVRIAGHIVLVYHIVLILPITSAAFLPPSSPSSIFLLDLHPITGQFKYLVPLR